MIELIKELSLLCGTSGREDKIREYIISKIEGKCQYSVDALGNLICFKKGKKTPKYKVMLDAHMDEVGVIVTSATSDGMLKFSNVGGIDTKVMLGKALQFENGAKGVVGVTPVHLLTADEKGKMPSGDSLYIDIGASSKEEALSLVKIGETGVFISDFIEFGDSKIKGKALDDRVGCAILIDMINSDLEYDTYFSFSVQEEIGLRGAGVSSFTVAPDFAICLETTTAADILDIPEHKTVCKLGGGAAISFMDRSTLYPKTLFDKAFEVAGKNGIKVQPKTLVAGGNNAGAVHKSGRGISTITLNAPCRYLHSPACVCDIRDINALRQLAMAMATELCND